MNITASLHVAISSEEAAAIIRLALDLPEFAEIKILRPAKKAKEQTPAPAPTPKMRDVTGEELSKLVIAVDTRIHNGEFNAAAAIIRNATGYTPEDCDYIAANWRGVRLAWNVLKRSIRPSLVPVN